MRIAMTGWCITAKAIEEGRFQSERKPDDLRAQCTAIDCAEVCDWRRAGNPPGERFQPTQTARPKGRVTRTDRGICIHCGGGTGGGLFAPGHDSKLRSELMASYTSGATAEVREEALVELMARKWLHRPATYEEAAVAVRSGLAEDPDGYLARINAIRRASFTPVDGEAVAPDSPEEASSVASVGLDGDLGYVSTDLPTEGQTEATDGLPA